MRVPTSGLRGSGSPAGRSPGGRTGQRSDRRNATSRGKRSLVDSSEQVVAVRRRSRPPARSSLANLNGEDAFAAFYKANIGRAISYARRRGVFDPDAVANDAMLRALRRLDPRKGSFRGFFWRVLRGLVADDYRREKRRQGIWNPIPEGLEPRDECSEALVSYRNLREEVGIALAKLPVRDRLLFLQHYEEGLSLSEIARRS